MDEMSGEIEYGVEPNLTADEFIDILVRSSLAERRPVADRDRIVKMLAQADLILTARHAGQLIGVARAITDFSYCTYLSDLAVDERFQRRGIGHTLLRKTHAAAGLDTMLILLSAPAAESYYPHIGLQPHGSCWILPRKTTDT